MTATSWFRFKIPDRKFESIFRANGEVPLTHCNTINFSGNYSGHQHFRRICSPETVRCGGVAQAVWKRCRSGAVGFPGRELEQERRHQSGKNCWSYVVGFVGQEGTTVDVANSVDVDRDSSTLSTFPWENRSDSSCPGLGVRANYLFNLRSVTAIFVKLIDAIGPSNYFR